MPVSMYICGLPMADSESEQALMRGECIMATTSVLYEC